MEKADILLIGLILGTIAYFLWELYLPPQTTISTSIETMPENTRVSLQGFPSNVRKYEKDIRFYLNGLEIRASSIDLVEKSNISVVGYVSNYNGKTYVEALQINYAH